TQESLFQFQSDAIRKTAESVGGVFVGRAADYVLRDYNNVVNIFITANLEDRIQSVMKRNNCDAETAEKIIEKKEEKRASFYAFYTGKKWGHSTSYDLCISSSILGLDKTTDFIADFVCKALEINE
ncbi:MAG: cytidylate kinase-like family protein, partial [Prevotella nanceiensis]|nr:cytidylate kinase-like family protein [Hoylesella nanceiensis]